MYLAVQQKGQAVGQFINVWLVNNLQDKVPYIPPHGRSQPAGPLFIRTPLVVGK